MVLRCLLANDSNLSFNAIKSGIPRHEESDGHNRVAIPIDLNVGLHHRLTIESLCPHCCPPIPILRPQKSRDKNIAFRTIHTYPITHPWSLDCRGARSPFSPSTDLLIDQILSSFVLKSQLSFHLVHGKNCCSIFLSSPSTLFLFLFPRCSPRPHPSSSFCLKNRQSILAPDVLPCSLR